MQAYMYETEGQRWLRIIDATGQEWDEPIAGWSMVVHLCEGYNMWKHTDGRLLKDTPKGF
jgi:hypothetical protein